MLQDLVAAYERQAAADISLADRSLLTDARDARDRLTPEQRLAPANVRATVRLFVRLGQRAAKVDLLAEYLTRDLSSEDEAWARWQRTDTLASLRRFDEAVCSQRAFYEWATKHLEPERLLWVMYDGTQALAWWASGRLNEWLVIVHSLRTAAGVNEHTRWDWFQLDRTEAMVLAREGRAEEALAVADLMTALSDRCPSWDQAEGVRMEAEFARMDAMTRGDRDAEFDTVAYRVTESLAGFQRTYADASHGPQQYGMLCNNAAAKLFFAHRYERAMPLFREVIRLRRVTIHAYIWMAASVWATSGDRQEVLDLVRAAAQRDPSRSIWRRVRALAAFEDITDDLEFEAAATGA